MDNIATPEEKLEITEIQDDEKFEMVEELTTNLVTPEQIIEEVARTPGIIKEPEQIIKKSLEIAGDVNISKKLNRKHLIERIRELSEKLNVPPPKAITKMKRDDLKTELGKLLNAGCEQIQSIPDEMPMGTPEITAVEGQVVNALYRFSLIVMNVGEKISKTEKIQKYTGGIYLDGWASQFEGPDESCIRMRDELRQCLLEIHHEYDLSCYLSCWSRLWLLLGASAMQSAKFKQ